MWETPGIDACLLMADCFAHICPDAFDSGGIRSLLRKVAQANIGEPEGKIRIGQAVTGTVCPVFGQC